MPQRKTPNNNRGVNIPSKQTGSAILPRTAPVRENATQQRLNHSEPSSTSAGKPSGEPSSNKGGGGQSSVRAMIQRLDRKKSGPGSPSKRRREADQSESASLPSESDSEDAGEALTKASMKATMLEMVGLIKQDMSEEFQSLRQDISTLNARISDLEKHIESRDCLVDDLERSVRSRDGRICYLEEEVDRLTAEARLRNLFLSGTAVPAPPTEERWKEDVVGTALTALNQTLPEVNVTREDIDDATRLSSKTVLVSFKSAARTSARQRVYEGRFKLFPQRPTNDSDTRQPVNLSIREHLSPYRQAIFNALIEERKVNKLYSVFTRDGNVFCKTKQHGRKIKVDTLERARSVIWE